jgi:hypothetical protein
MGVTALRILTSTEIKQTRILSKNLNIKRRSEKIGSCRIATFIVQQPRKKLYDFDYLEKVSDVFWGTGGLLRCLCGTPMR